MLRAKQETQKQLYSPSPYCIACSASRQSRKGKWTALANKFTEQQSQKKGFFLWYLDIVVIAFHFYLQANTGHLYTEYVQGEYLTIIPESSKLHPFLLPSSISSKGVIATAGRVCSSAVGEPQAS